MPGIRLQPEAVIFLEKYSWPGNIRQLKNVAEQISVIEKSRDVSESILNKYLEIDSNRNLPMIIDGKKKMNKFLKGIFYIRFSLK